MVRIILQTNVLNVFIVVTTFSFTSMFCLAALALRYKRVLFMVATSYSAIRFFSVKETDKTTQSLTQTKALHKQGIMAELGVSGCCKATNRAFHPYQGGRSSHPLRNWRRKINMCIFIAFLHSLFTQTHFSLVDLTL